MKAWSLDLERGLGFVPVSICTLSITWWVYTPWRDGGFGLYCPDRFACLTQLRRMISTWAGTVHG